MTRTSQSDRLIICAVCSRTVAASRRRWGNNAGNGHAGDSPTCSATCAEQLRQRKAGAA